MESKKAGCFCALNAGTFSYITYSTSLDTNEFKAAYSGKERHPLVSIAVLKSSPLLIQVP